MYSPDSERSIRVRNLIYSRAHQMTRQITLAAEEIGRHAAQERRNAHEEAQQCTTGGITADGHLQRAQ